MKKQKKSIIACGILAVGFALAGVGSLNVASMNADSVTASAAESTAGFQVSDGAQVLLSANSNGIRFETKISEDYYTALTTEFSTGTFTFYTVINRAENPVEDDKYVYTHTVDANSFTKGYATYYSAIRYDDLTTEELKVASAMELKATAYVDIAVEGQTTVTREATANDTTRSMRSVANLALASGDYANDSTSTTQLKKYLGENITRNEALEYIETSAKPTTLTVENAAVGMDVYFNGKNTGLTVEEGGVVDISQVDLSAAYTLGEEICVSAFNDDNDVVSTKFKYVTQAIETEDEFRAFSTAISKGGVNGNYYVLANNIECTNTAPLGTSQHWNNLSITLDGQGYYVNGLFVGTYGVIGGRFGYVVKTDSTQTVYPAIIKNIAFTNVNSTVETPHLITSDNHAAGSLSNVYISATCANLTLFDTNTASQQNPLCDAVILENCAGIFSGKNTYANGYALSTNSLYMISATETPVSLGEPKYATNSMQDAKYTYDNKTGAGGVYWYASYEDMANANISSTATTNEPTIKYFNDCWDLTDGYPVWKNLPAEKIVIAEKQYVEQPTAEYGTTTATGYSALALNGVQDETVSVSINSGEAVTLNVADGAVQIPWTVFANAGVTLGQTVPMLVTAADGTTWSFSEVMYVTQAIRTEDDLQSFSTLVSKGSYDGRYYVLANNIECKNTTGLGTLHWNIFTSTLDGQGYYINNMYVSEYGFLGGRFGQKNKPATIKNIAFTNVNSTKETPRLISNDMLAYAAAYLDNVYVSAACENLTLYGAGYIMNVGVAFNAVVLENCAGVYSGNSSSTGYFVSTNSLYMISETETPVALGDSRYATNTTKTGVNTYTYDTTDAKRGGMYWYASYELMAADVKATATASAPTIAYFNDCWDLTDGYPVWKNLPAA